MKKIPTSITLPFGYRIKVRYAETFVCERTGRKRGNTLGYWDGDSRTIYLNKTRSKKCQRADLIHEMGHALTDWQSEMQWRRSVDLRQ